MDAFRIRGGRKLAGTCEIGGAKNAALPIMAAALLIQGRTLIHRVPRLRDVDTMNALLERLGARGGHTDHSFEIDATGLSSHEAPWEIVRRMRASVYVLGPLLARFGRARVSLPGGCAWGPRPVDLHIKGMELLGASVSLEHGYITAQAPPGGLRGGRISFDISSVGATGNVLMAACLAKGNTVIKNPAREPEISALADFLNAAGARISGQGTDEIRVQGVAFLRPVEFENIPDRVEAGTYLAAAAITGSAVTLQKVRPEHLTLVLDRVREMGVGVTVDGDSIRVTPPENGRLRAIDISTQPYPGFPTDLQAQFMAMLCVAEGSGVVTDTIYPDRFAHVPELQRLGAEIRLQHNVATVRGRPALEGASVMSTDIRASSALVLAGLVAHGETRIHRVYHIDRGYEAIERRLQSLGADITRYDAPDRSGDAPLIRGLAGLLLLFLAGAFLPGPLFWGVNHLAYLPRWATGVWIAAAGLLFIPALRRALSRMLAGPIPRFLFESRAGRWITPVAAGAVFWLFRSRSFFLGDGHLLSELSTQRVAFHGFDDMDYALHSLVFRLANGSSLDSAFRVFQVISVISGMAGVAVNQELLRRLSWEPWRRALVFLLLLATGPVSLYFGYVEAYSILVTFLTAFFLSGLLALEGRLSPWVCSIFFGLAVFAHLTAVFSGTALLFLFVQLRDRPWPRRLLQLGAPAAAAAAIWVLIHLVLGLDQEWLKKGFIGNEHARRIVLPLTGEHALLTWFHWKDLANQLLLTAPVPLVILLARAKRLSWRGLGAGERFLLVQVATLGILGILIDRKLGMARDWDLLLAQSTAIVPLAAMLIRPPADGMSWNGPTTNLPPPSHPAADHPPPNRKAADHRPPNRMPAEAIPGSAAWILASSVLLCAPWIVLVHSDPASANRLAGVAADFPDFAKPYTYEELGMHFRLLEDYERAEEMYKTCVEAGPDNPRFRINLGTVYAIRGKNEEAQKQYAVAQQQFEKALQANPGDTVVQRRLAQMLAWQGENARAADLYAGLVRSEPQDVSLWAGLGQSALKAGRAETAARALDHALTMGADPALRRDLAMALVKMGRVEDGVGLYRRLLQEGDADPTTRTGLAGALIASARANQGAEKSLSSADLGEIRGLLESVLQSRPDDAEARALEGELGALGAQTPR